MTGPALVLHVGLQQSGGGVLLRALTRLRPQLRRHGVAYLGHDAIAALNERRGWIAAGPGDPAEQRRFGAALAEAVDAELGCCTTPRRRRPPTVLLCSDSLIGEANVGGADHEAFRPLAVPALAQVVDAVRPSRTTVVLYTRRQDRLMELCYAREILNGARHPFDEQFPYAEKPHLDYLDLVERIAGMPAVVRVEVRPYEAFAAAPDAHVDHLLRAVGLAGRMGLREVRSLRPRPPVSARGLQIALRMNEFLETPTEISRAKDFVLRQFAARDERDARFLDAEQRRRILAAHADLNAELFRRYAPSVAPDAYASDAATDRLPERVRVSPPPLGRRLVRRGLRTARRLRGQVRR